jgi:hypothetical protein
MFKCPTSGKQEKIICSMPDTETAYAHWQLSRLVKCSMLKKLFARRQTLKTHMRTRTHTNV